MKALVLNPSQVQAVLAVQRLTHAALRVLSRECRARCIFKARLQVLEMEGRREETLNLFVARTYFGLTFAVAGNRITLRK